MIKIGIDARLYSQTGVGTYLRNYIFELSRIIPPDYLLYLYILPEDKKKIQNQSDKVVLRDAPCKWHTLSEQTRFFHIVSKDNLDLMHFTYFGYPVLYKRTFVATIHDLTPLLYRTGKASTKSRIQYAFKHAVFKYIFRSQINRASAIITPTKTVKKQLISYFGKAVEKKTYPLYEGVGYELKQASESKHLRLVYDKPFFLYIGNCYPHKNLERLVHAFAGIKRRQNLILVGPNDFFTQKLKKLSETLHLEQNILFYHDPTFNDLVFFYKRARALIHPSLSEGFGLPLIEAAYFRLPIIASSIPVIQEVLGDSYIMFDPYNINDIRKKIQTFMENPITFQHGGLEQIFSFKSMSQNTLSIYKQVLKQRYDV